MTTIIGNVSDDFVVVMRSDTICTAAPVFKFCPLSYVAIVKEIFGVTNVHFLL